jgi:ABC-type antimicrobial peptide transport system permease subunit
MISLGLGMQQSIYREVEQSGGLTTITVRGAGAGDSIYYYDEDSDSSNKYINDEAIEEMAKLDHVSLASPVYEMSVIMLKGNYQGWGELVAMTPEALQAMNIELAEGTLPDPNSGELEILYGNGILTSFTENGNNDYYETGEAPDIDLANDSIFLILDEEGYYNSQSGDSGSLISEDGTATQSQPVKKHVVKASGITAGGLDEYTTHYYNMYCNLDTLKQILKKDFVGRTIPGQPTTQSGKAYKEFCYSYAQVKVDDIDNVDSVVSAIRELGYSASTNAEYLDSMKKELAIVEAVLGGIGAVSLLVAAIGIANTMMMSIYERTKEIGVIKVLGCSLKNIKQMFLLEAAFIGLIGGVAGNVLSFLMSAGINLLTGHGSALGFDGNISYIPLWLVLLSLGFAMLVGVTAGYFPALRAMKLSPLAAIRNE